MWLLYRRPLPSAKIGEGGGGGFTQAMIIDAYQRNRLIYSGKGFFGSSDVLPCKRKRFSGYRFSLFGVEKLQSEIRLRSQAANVSLG